MQQESALTESLQHESLAQESTATTVSAATESVAVASAPLPPQEKRDTLITTARDKNNFFIFVFNLD